MSNSKSFFRCIAVILALLTVSLLPANIIGVSADAAAKKTLYIGEVKLFIKEKGTIEDAQNWCDDQEENKDSDSTNDWVAVRGDLNDGASGEYKNQMAVFMCCKTTDDASKAVRDMAVMNERGNYSADAYEILLKEQKDVYADLVSDMKEMLTEYRANYNNKVPVAVKAHDFLNGYIEDDSQKLLGDLLLDVSDEELANILLQANGMVVLAVQNQIASACDTKKTTWLDRMEKLGSYKNLRKQFLKAYNNNASKADKALEKQYHEKALALTEIWEDIYSHVNSTQRFIEQYGLADMSNEMFQAWMKDNMGNDKEFAFLEELSVLRSLQTYKYGDTNLLDYFNVNREKIKENIKELYPLAASLSDGQFCALNESVSLFALVQDAIGADFYNDYESSKATKAQEDLSSDEKKVVEDMKSYVDEQVDKWTDGEKTSIYEGIDRDIFKDGGVAVTSNAQTYSNGSNNSWADKFIESGVYTKCMQGMGIACGISAVLAIGFKCLQETAIEKISVSLFNELRTADYAYDLVDEIGIKAETIAYCRACTDYSALERRAIYGLQDDALAVMVDIRDTVARSDIKYKLITGLKVGFAVFSILLGVADIALTAVTLYKYYNRDHLPIPHHMVDLSYNEDSETSYIVYKSVLDTKGKYGDLNADGGKQWLAIYATTDEDAGDPIIAPTEDDDSISVIYGKTKAPDGYAPLHYFGKPNTAQNLTYADGESGWSYKDRNNGTFLFFKRDANAVLHADDTATTTSDGNIVLFLGLGLLAGLILGIGGTVIVIKKKKKTS